MTKDSESILGGLFDNIFKARPAPDNRHSVATYPRVPYESLTEAESSKPKWSCRWSESVVRTWYRINGIPLKRLSHGCDFMMEDGTPVEVKTLGDGIRRSQFAEIVKAIDNGKMPELVIVDKSGVAIRARFDTRFEVPIPVYEAVLEKSWDDRA